MENHVYNLMKQLVQENKSLWRIKNNYIKDAGSCNECSTFWERLEKDKEEHIEELTALVKKHLE